MAAAPTPFLVLTYHAVSDGAGPTCMPPGVFAAQLDALVDAGFASATLDDLIRWRAGAPLDGPKALITFDDALADFVHAAHPLLRARGLHAVMFAPTGKLGGVADWDGGAGPFPPLMTWHDASRLAQDGVTFAAHGVAHRDLTTLPAPALADELDASAAAIESRLGQRPIAFAAPFGRVNATVLAAIAQRYALAFGTRFDVMMRDAPAHDIPRIDMHYFRDPKRWRAFLDGARGYFAVRKALRAARTLAAAALARG